MERVNVWSLRPARRSAQTRRFVDAGQEGREPVTISLTLRPLSNPEQAVAFERGEQLVGLFLTGDAETGEPPMEFPAVGGQSVPVSRTLLHNAVALEMMQPPELTERYTAIEIAGLSAGLSTPVWRQILAWVAELEAGADDLSKNAHGQANTNGSCAPA